MGSIQIGYGSDTRSRGPKNAYAGRTGGKKVMNGGFGNMPTISFETVSDDKFLSIFGNAYLPKWKRELLENGESLDS